MWALVFSYSPPYRWEFNTQILPLKLVNCAGTNPTGATYDPPYYYSATTQYRYVNQPISLIIGRGHICLLYVNLRQLQSFKIICYTTSNSRSHCSCTNNFNGGNPSRLPSTIAGSGIRYYTYRGKFSRRIFSLGPISGWTTLLRMACSGYHNTRFRRITILHWTEKTCGIVSAAQLKVMSVHVTTAGLLHRTNRSVAVEILLHSNPVRRLEQDLVSSFSFGRVR